MKNKTFNYLISILFIVTILLNFTSISRYINSFIWSITTILLLICGAYFSVKLKFVQLNCKKIIISLFSKSNSFKSLSLALASRIGVGSLSGIALAIYVGGPGTIFWLWICSIITVINTYVESYYGNLYQDNNLKGGPSYYIRKGLGNKYLSYIYALLILFTYSFVFVTIQSNTIIRSVNQIVNINTIFLLIALGLVTAILIFKSIPNLIKAISKIVPIMLLSYLLLGIYVILNNLNILDNIFIIIIKSAFDVKTMGIGIITPLIIGVQRGIFATEVGIGTSAMAAASVKNDSNSEGILQVVGVYFTSLIICTLTAFIILTSNYQDLSFLQINGIEITLMAFKYHYGIFGTLFLCFITCLFAFTTIVSSYYYGEINLSLLKKRNSQFGIFLFKIIFILVVIIGGIINPHYLWKTVDVLIAFLVIINLYSLLKLYKTHNKKIDIK